MKKTLACIILLLFSSTAVMAASSLHVSSNGRYLVDENGNSFFPQNDWANQLPWMVSTEYVDLYMDNRKAQGFNVISMQAVFDCVNDADYASKTNIIGLLPFATNNAYFGRWDITKPIEAYWANVDNMINSADAKGLYVALAPLPTYGLLLYSQHTMERGDDATCYAFGNWVGKRYASKTNIIWLAGLGIPQNSYFDIRSQVNALAKGIADGVNGVSNNVGVTDYSTTLMGYYTWRWSYTSAHWFGSEDWLDFNSVAEVPGREGTSQFQIPELESDYARTPVKPTWLMGPIYEAQKPEFNAPQSRFQAWQSVLAGGFGSSFGNQTIADFNPGWSSSINSDGAKDMQYLTSVVSPIIADLLPDQSLIVGDKGAIIGSGWYMDGSTIIQAARTSDGRNAVIYSAYGNDITVAMNKLYGTEMKAEWLDPRTGVKTFIRSVTSGAGAANALFAAPGSPDQDNDQVLLLTWINIYDPIIDITNENTTVNYETSQYTIGGINNHNVVGTMNWLNQLTGETGNKSAALSWTISNIALDVGTNVIVITGTNIYGETAEDIVKITRKKHIDIVAEMNLIRDNLMPWAISYSLRGEDPILTVSEYLNLLNPNGSFSDSSSTIGIMTGRLLFMAQSFKNDPAWKNNANLKTNLYNAVQYWLDHDPGNSGWTAGCFNEPGSMDSIGLCLYDAVQQDKNDHPEMVAQLDALVNGMVDWANAAWTESPGGELFVGANISYRLMGMIGRAALANSPEMFDDITNAVQSTFMDYGNYLDNGMSSDKTWHQHNYSGGQDYWMGYGADWMNITRNSFKYIKDTQWELTRAQLNIFADCIIDGWQWQIYRYQGAYPLGGRHNSVKSALYNNYIVGQIYLLRNYVGSETLDRDDELLQAKTRIENSGDSASYPSFDMSKYFYKSDLMIYGKPYSYVATKMLSNRTAGPESGSGDGKLNYHFGEGSTMIFKTGDEYKTARVGWNFRAVPGCTIEQKTGDLPTVDWGQRNGSSNPFAGGVEDSHYGLCAFQLDHSSYNNDYNKITANKSYFFFDNEFVALGSKIKYNGLSTGYEVWTTIDQPERKTDVTYSIAGGALQTILLSSNLQTDFNNITAGAWFYCNDKGYIILPDSNGVDIKLWAEMRTGDWHDLSDRYPVDETESVNIFQLSINHHTSPDNEGYGYIVLPNITKDNLTNYYANIPIKVLENSDSIQAVQLSESNLTEMIFYKNDSLSIDSKSTVTVDRAAIVMFNKAKDKISIAIADPNQNQDKILFTINEYLGEGTNIVWDSSTGESEITFYLPQGIYAGHSVKKEFAIIPEPVLFGLTGLVLLFLRRK